MPWHGARLGDTGVRVRRLRRRVLGRRVLGLLALVVLPLTACGDDESAPDATDAARLRAVTTDLAALTGTAPSARAASTDVGSADVPYRRARVRADAGRLDALLPLVRRMTGEGWRLTWASCRAPDTAGSAPREVRLQLARPFEGLPGGTATVLADVRASAYADDSGGAVVEAVVPHHLDTSTRYRVPDADLDLAASCLADPPPAADPRPAAVEGGERVTLAGAL
ncbi:hypothetical protein [Angustibacter aerolatus]